MSDAEQVALRNAILSSPSLFPFECSATGDAILFVEMSEADYQRASFLDQRLLAADEQTGNTRRQGVIPWATFSPWLFQLPIDCDFIFHISHAGSTLLSRLLGLIPEVLSLREPLILRSIADSRNFDQLPQLLSLWSRTFHWEQRALIKATSFVSEIAIPMMQVAGESRSLLMAVPPKTFLASVLDGSMSDILSRSASRLERLQRHGIAMDCQADKLSPGEAAAMSWLAETNSLRVAASQFPYRTLVIDFDRFVKTPLPVVESILRFLQLDADPEHLLTHPLMTRYAKKIEVHYDSGFRQKLIDAAASKYSDEIAKGLAWLKSVEPTLAID